MSIIGPAERMQSSYTLQDQQLMALAKNYFAWQSQLVTRHLGQRVLEVGCGVGNFTRMLLDRHAVMALDAEPECVEHLRRAFAGQPNLRTLVADWGAPDWERHVLPCAVGFRADSCVCLNVLEHIRDDVEAVRRMASVLQPGGIVVLLLPAFPALYGPIDRSLGHFRRYTRRSVRELASSAGLNVATLHYMNAIGFFGWWANARIFKRTAQSAGQIALFDRYIVPFSCQIEKLLKPPFGQSLLAVLRKP